MTISEQNRWKNGGSYRKYYYTVKDIARITSRSEGTIRNDVYKQKLDMADLISVSEYVMRFKNA